MTLTITEIAATLDNAELSGVPVAQLNGALSLSEAYAVQSAILERRLSRGERFTGSKLGFTSKAKMAQMEVNEIIVGFLTDKMALSEGEEVDLNGLVHPRVEPELIFRLDDEVSVSQDDTPESLSIRLQRTAADVAVGLEVIDSRYEDFKFSLADVVADNTSACRYLVGEWQPMREELSGLQVALTINGEVIEQSTSNAILGDPLRAFDELAVMALKYGFRLPAGSLILAGAMTPAAPLIPGASISAEVDEFPAVTFYTRGGG